MLADKTYQATAVGVTGTMTYAGLVAVGAASDPAAGYEAFAAEVAKLEAMEVQRLVAITYRHHESQTGKKYVDLIRFTRMR